MLGVRWAALLVSVIACVCALPGSASTILGTSAPETIRETAGRDRISAGAGDDRMFGLAGNEVLTGGAGRDVVRGGARSDRLLLRDGEADTAVCGPGRDFALVDRADVVLADCEMMRVQPPDPPAPPPRPVVSGVYGGRTTQGELVTFRVDSGGALTRLAFGMIQLSCADGTSLECLRTSERPFTSSRVTGPLPRSSRERALSQVPRRPTGSSPPASSRWASRRGPCGSR